MLKSRPYEQRVAARSNHQQPATASAGSSQLMLRLIIPTTRLVVYGRQVGHYWRRLQKQLLLDWYLNSSTGWKDGWTAMTRVTKPVSSSPTCRFTHTSGPEGYDALCVSTWLVQRVALLRGQTGIHCCSAVFSNGKKLYFVMERPKGPTACIFMKMLVFKQASPLCLCSSGAWHSLVTA